MTMEPITTHAWEQRALKEALARPGRPHGDRIGDAVADVLRATAMDLRAEAR